MSTKKQRKARWNTLISVILILLLSAYLIYQMSRSVFDTVTTESAVLHSVYESIKTEGLVFRSEAVISPGKEGYRYYSVENGSRVSKDSIIASVYADENSGRIEQQMQEIDAQIAALKEIQSDGSSGHITLDVINEQLTAAQYAMIQAVNNGDLQKIPELRFTLLSLMSKKQIVTGKPISFTEKIDQLTAQKASLNNDFQKAIAKVRAPVAGYFVDRTDGLEDVLTVDKVEDLTVDQLTGYLEDSRNSKAGPDGKIVSGYQWYMACIVPDSYYNVLGKGKELSLRMSFVLDESVPVTVHACKKDGSGQMAVVFRCDYMSDKLSTIRQETVEIQLVKHTGLKVPKRAIVVGEDQQAFVYVRRGNVASKKKIDQKFSEPADYVICTESDDPEYLRLYDDIIIGGKDLYDGKIIH